MSEMVSRDEGEPFGVPKIHKWAENIEHILNEWSYDTVYEHFGVDEVSELTVEQIQEIEDFVEESGESWYDHVLIGFKNVISEWENENNDND